MGEDHHHQGKIFLCLPFLNPTSEMASLPTFLPPTLPGCILPHPSAGSGLSLSMLCSQHFSSGSRYPPRSQSHSVTPFCSQSCRGGGRVSSAITVRCAWASGHHCLPGMRCQRQPGMALKKPWINHPGRWECAQNQGLVQSAELPWGFYPRRVLPQQARALLFSHSLLSVNRTQDLGVQPDFIRGQNIGEKHFLLWEIGSSEQASAALVSRAGRQSQTVAHPQGMIPHPVDALLLSPGQLSLTWQESCRKGIEGKAEEAERGAA